METFKTYEEWSVALREANHILKEINAAIPAYYQLFKDMINAKEKNWRTERPDDDPYRERTQMVSVNVFDEYMNRWLDLSFPDSKRLWEVVKDYNTCCSHGDKFNTKTMFETQKRLKNHNKPTEVLNDTSD